MCFLATTLASSMLLGNNPGLRCHFMAVLGRWVSVASIVGRGRVNAYLPMVFQVSFLEVSTFVFIRSPPFYSTFR